ncbi:MAG: NAD(P)H-hydrate dehydratase [Cyanobacteria bacterium J06642_3]
MSNSLADTIVVSAQQMRDIEGRIFAKGMPVAALMEKAAQACFHRIKSLYPQTDFPLVGVIAGSGHNGGDALVVSRELHLDGYQVKVYQPLPKLKELTAAHAKYAANLEVPISDELESLSDCQVIIDGLFGFGLERSLSGDLAQAIDKLNSWQKPVVSIDLPSGINTDTGAVMGTAVKATHTLCLGLWKRAFLQDQALEYLGNAQKLGFGIPEKDIKAIVPENEYVQVINAGLARQFSPLPRPILTHKYQQGNLLLICGSRRYAGAAILTALGARASGVGMLTIAVPESLRELLIAQVPEALVIGCPETASGAIASLPLTPSEINKFEAIACGSGLTQEATEVIEQIITCPQPLILDADALNIVAAQNNLPNIIHSTSGIRILTPHLGEFKRLFPNLDPASGDRISLVQTAAVESQAIVLLKGARTVISQPNKATWIVPESTPALARGGSGDVLTGLLGGLIAGVVASSANDLSKVFNSVALAAWWHAQAAIKAAQASTQLGVDGVTLASYLATVF